jgi:hypothetical protein
MAGKLHSWNGWYIAWQEWLVHCIAGMVCNSIAGMGLNSLIHWMSGIVALLCWLDWNDTCNACLGRVFGSFCNTCRNITFFTEHVLIFFRGE